MTAQGRKVTVKRIAIATRWGMAAAGPANPRISVKDPIDKGEHIDPQEKDALFIGLLRLHIANLIRPLGHAQLANALYQLTHQPLSGSLEGDLQLARTLLDAARIWEGEKASGMDGLLGGVVTRAGPVTDAVVAPADQEVLARLNLRPVFVGIKPALIRAAIDAEPQALRDCLTQTESSDELARPDRAGGWIVPLGRERRIIGRI